jgi:hypothetical protein
LASTAPVLAHRSRAQRDQPVSLGRFIAGQLLDDIAYGAGVYAGCFREHTLAPLRPASPFRHDRSTTTEVT